MTAAGVIEQAWGCGLQATVLIHVKNLEMWATGWLAQGICKHDERRGGAYGPALLVLLLLLFPCVNLTL